MRRFFHPLIISCSLAGSLHAQLSQVEGNPEISLASGLAMKVESNEVPAPAAITFDGQGRLYVNSSPRLKSLLSTNIAQEWLLDDLAAHSAADRKALFEKWSSKPPLQNLTNITDHIVRLADTNADGTLDQATPLFDAADTNRGILFHEGVLFLGSTRSISAMLAEGAGGKAEPLKTLDEGFGVRISLPRHDLSGLVLGPDGRIYGATGDSGHISIFKNGALFDSSNTGSVFRFEIDGSNFQIVQTGLRNPGEIAFDRFGNGFVVDGPVVPGEKARVFQLMENADSGWRMEDQAFLTTPEKIGLPKDSPNRWQAEKLGELSNADQPAYLLPPLALLDLTPAGMTTHPVSDGFLIADWRTDAEKSGVWSFSLKEKGAGFQLTDLKQIASGLTASDLSFSPQGRLFISDFSKDRIVSLGDGAGTWPQVEQTEVSALLKEGFSQRSSAELLGMLKHPDSRVRLQAQMALVRKPDAVAILMLAARDKDPLQRIHGIRGLGMIARGLRPLPDKGGFGTMPRQTDIKSAIQPLLEHLNDPDPVTRCEILRVLSDLPPMGDQLPLHGSLVDDSPHVRALALIAAGKHQTIGLYGPICEAIANNPKNDPVLRLAGVYALRHLMNGTEQLLSFTSSPSPEVRLAAVIALRQNADPRIADFVNDSSPLVADEAIRAITDLGLANARPVVAEQLDDLTARKWSPYMLHRLLHNAYRIGTAENATRLANFAASRKQPLPLRLEAVRLLSLWSEPPAIDQLTGLWQPLEKRDGSEAKKAARTAVAKLAKEAGPVRTALENFAKSTP